jgi:hypothetical protein
MVFEWEAYALDHSDERWGVGRNMVKAGHYHFEKHPRTYSSRLGAEKKADELNKIRKAELCY